MTNTPQSSRSFRRLWSIVHSASILLLIISCFADLFSPSISPLFMFTNMAFIAIFAVNLGLFLATIALKQRKWSYGYLGVFAVCLSKLLIFFPINLPTLPTTSENTWTIISYNVNYLSGCQDHTLEKANPTVRYLQRTSADILCLQEVAWNEEKPGMLTRQRLSTALSQYPYSRFVRLNQLDCWSEGLAVFSKYPIQNIHILPTHSLSNGAFRFEVERNGQRITIVNFHLESNKLGVEEKKVLKNLSQGKSINKIDSITHSISEKISAAALKRAQQARLIQASIEKAPGAVILCGDLNDPPNSYTYTNIRGSLNDAYKKVGLGLGTTYNHNGLHYRIDHVFYSEPLVPLYSRIKKAPYSDHYPIEVCFTYNKE